MFKISIAFSFILILAAVSCAQNTSVYTSFRDDQCNIVNDPKIGGNMTGTCPAVGGYRLKMYADDGRMSVGIVAPSQKLSELDFWGYFSNFSSVGEKAEWRLKGKTPIALIVRYEVSDQGDNDKKTSYLMVAKINARKSCVVAIVKPGKTQNEDARRLADNSANMFCKKTE